MSNQREVELLLELQVNLRSDFLKYVFNLEAFYFLELLRELLFEPFVKLLVDTGSSVTPPHVAMCLALLVLQPISQRVNRDFFAELLEYHLHCLGLGSCF